jgi:[glutamine synthetase] adenylyltransferase / [glutamine synthetase]-adenylyl-L-tyrosine phosphorylase
MLSSVADRRAPNSAQSVDLGLFRDPARARDELQTLRAVFPADLFAVLLSLLAEIPDPGQALSLLERLVQQSPEQAAAFASSHALLHHALVIFGHSYWLGEMLVRHPDLLPALEKDRGMERTREREDFRGNLAAFRSREDGNDASLLLARFKKREYVRIMLRDVLGIAMLAETTAEISALADVVIEEGLREAEARMRSRHGVAPAAENGAQPARFTVLALGKLGGNELNYSSDVDLLYLYDGGEPRHGPLSLREYFVRQAQLLTEILSCATPEGPVFRIDLRLRPQGQEGEPAVALRHALDYYARGAQDWELQALIKARHSAGDRELARAFVRAVQPRVYAPSINFAAIETALNSRRRMGEHRRRSLARRKEPATIDVKLDRGGIRDIEFLVQCLQRVYGGEEPWLRACGTLFSLRKLNDKGRLNAADFHQLSLAYEFLRAIEHRLQLQRGQQLHRLPSSAHELQVLARSLGRKAPADAAGLVRVLRRHMGRVAAIYERIVHSQKQREKGPEAGADSYYIGARELSFEQVMRRTRSDSEALYRALSPPDLSPHARKNLHRFLGSAMGAAERYAVLLENPAAAARAAALFETSDYLSDVLVRHPRLLPLLGPQADGLSGAERLKLSGPGKAGSDLNESLALLRRNFLQASFAQAARDALQPGPVFAAMKESTRMAEEAIRAALRIVNGEQTLAVFALGRLGTAEFDIASDADLLFVRAPEADEDEARLDAERLVHALSAYTKEGPLFAVDARLRPHGGEGELVAAPAQVEKYLAEEAQPWEALTYSKLRFVAGREDVAMFLLPQVWHQIVEAAFRSGFSAAVREMRARLEKSNRYPHSFKLAAGGFYDVDFIAAYVMLTQASLAEGNTEERLQHLHGAGLLETAAFEKLREAALLYRATDHAVRLVTGRARPELPAAGRQRHAVEKMAARILGWREERDLQSELRKTQAQVREMFLEMVGQRQVPQAQND